jgi:hypothetical protein
MIDLIPSVLVLVYTANVQPTQFMFISPVVSYIDNIAITKVGRDIDGLPAKFIRQPIVL